MNTRKRTTHPFFDARPRHGNVVFNFTGNAIDDLSAFALGYHKSAKALVSTMECSTGYCDHEGYPILFLYRHALELYLKAIVYRGARLARLIKGSELNTEKLLTKHGLSRLLPHIKTIFDIVGWKWEFEVSGLKTYDDFEELVRGIDDIDCSSYSFRYPVNTLGDATLDEHLAVNVISFGKKMDPVLDLLNGAVTGLDELWDGAAEAEYDMQQMLKGVQAEL